MEEDKISRLFDSLNLVSDRHSINKILGLNERQYELFVFKLNEALISGKNDFCIDIQGIKINLVKNASKNSFIVDAFNSFTDYLQIAENFIKSQPIYYDSAKNWWIWNHNEKCYVLMDETDLLNILDKQTKNPSVNSKVKNEILESLRRVGRQNKPKEFKKSWIQFKNKIIDFKTDEIFDATPEFFSSNPIPWKLGDYEETPILDKLFKEWVGEKYVRTLYELISFCLVSDYPLHRVFCFYGSGLNGKGSFMRTLKKFIGVNNCCSTELDTLLLSRFEISRLHKKLVCMMTETNFEEISKTAMLKKLTGQDLIGYEYKNKNLFEDMNYAKIIISTNNLPPTSDKTIGFYRRWSIIDFPNQFDEGKNIEDSIPDMEFENLAKKSIKILKELLEYGKFTNEGTIEERAKKYEDLSNPFDKFWKENIDEDSDSHIGKTAFRQRLEQWCKENKFRSMSDGTIAKKMKDMKIFDSLQSFYNERGERIRFWAWNNIKWKISGSTGSTGSANPTPFHIRVNGVENAEPPEPPEPNEFQIKEEVIE